MPTSHNWNKVLPLAMELAGQASTWTALARAVSARLGPIPLATFKQGIKRETGQEFPTYAAFQAWALGQGDNPLSPLAQGLLAHLRGQGRDVPCSLLDLSETFDRSPSSILAAAKELRAADFYIEIADDRHIIMPTVQPPSRWRIPAGHWMQDRVHRFGLVSDSHLANRNARLDVLEALYDIFEQEGIESVLHAGNLIDGESKWNRSELVVHGVEGQLAYVIQHYPQRDGITTRFLTASCHEGWYGEGIGLDIGRYMHNSFAAYGRKDLEWLGHVEVDLELHPDNPQAVLRIFHPGGGSAYATSYPVQKHVEAWQGGEKPSVCIFGHYHKTGYFYPREVHCLLAACTCDQTFFMRKRKMAAHVGGWIVEIHMTAMGGVGRVKTEFVPFYDKGYYEARWDYLSKWLDTGDET